MSAGLGWRACDGHACSRRSGTRAGGQAALIPGPAFSGARLLAGGVPETGGRPSGVSGRRQFGAGMPASSIRSISRAMEYRGLASSARPTAARPSAPSPARHAAA